MNHSVLSWSAHKSGNIVGKKNIQVWIKNDFQVQNICEMIPFPCHHFDVELLFVRTNSSILIYYFAGEVLFHFTKVGASIERYSQTQITWVIDGYSVPTNVNAFEVSVELEKFNALRAFNSLTVCIPLTKSALFRTLLATLFRLF